jgi:hypothetical protein
MFETKRVRITPTSRTAQRHHGVLQPGKRLYVLAADIDQAGIARGVRLDGPYADHEGAEAKVKMIEDARGGTGMRGGSRLPLPANAFSLKSDHHPGLPGSWPAAPLAWR